MKVWLQSLRILIFFTVLTGGIYPVLVTLATQSFFPFQSRGSLIWKDDKLIGSELISQGFKNPKYFWPRPSAVDFNPMPSGGSNLGPTSQDLLAKVNERKAHGMSRDLLFASGSGLDPHISPESCFDQVEHVAKARNMTPDRVNQLKELINRSIENRQFGLFGEKRVNVLKLNLELDRGF